MKTVLFMEEKRRDGNATYYTYTFPYETSKLSDEVQENYNSLMNKYKENPSNYKIYTSKNNDATFYVHNSSVDLFAKIHPEFFKKSRIKIAAIISALIIIILIIASGAPSSNTDSCSICGGEMKCAICGKSGMYCEKSSCSRSREKAKKT